MRSKLLIAALVASIASVFTLSVAHSAPAEFKFSVDATAGVWGDLGEVVPLETVDVNPAFIGRTCTVVIDVHNNDSVRQGTDLLFETNGTTLTAANVEAQVGNAPPASMGEVVLGDTVTGSVRLGADALNPGEGVASASATFIVTCPDSPPPTTPTTTPDGTTVGGITVERGVATAATPATPLVVRPSFTG